MNTAIEPTYGTSVDRVLEETNCLITLPGVCLRLREVIADSTHSRSDVVEAISHDSALTARLLRIVNSAYFGLSQSVSDISHALAILGEQELNNLVIVTSIVSSLDNSASPMDMNRYWRASLLNAVTARNLARRCGLDENQIDELFVSGLLLNVGKLLLYSSEPELQREVERRVLESSRTDYQVEQELLGFDHTDVGALLASSWNFSPQLGKNISIHHAEDVSDLQRTDAIIILSAKLSDSMELLNIEFKQSLELGDSDLQLLKTLDITLDEYGTVIETSREEYLLAFEAFCH